MDKYCKPTIVGGGEINGLVPLAAIAAMSAAELAVIGAASGLGLAAIGGRDFSHSSKEGRKLQDLNNIM